MNKIRLRFAPAPTGELHMGNIRTAFINWLIAKKIGGELVLRIDDTDKSRNKEGIVETIERDFKWLGFEHCEKHYQSKREDKYAEAINVLKKNNCLYECFCSPKELEDEREAFLKLGKAPKYGGKCSQLGEEEIAQKKASGTKPTLRLRIPKDRGKIHWKDLIKGDQKFDALHFGDFIVVREDGTATYNLTSIIDDLELNISHLVRGEDHVSNTPRQILIAEALDTCPDCPEEIKNKIQNIQFGHTPLVLGADKKKLSKRNGSKTVHEYCELGVLPDALLNSLAHVCWAPPIDEEIFNAQRMVELFEVNKVHKSPSVYAEEKLKWISKEHLKKITDSSEQEGLLKKYVDLSFFKNHQEKVLKILWPELSMLSEAEEKIKCLKEDHSLKASDEERPVVKAWEESFSPNFSEWKKAAQDLCTVKGKKFFMPLRKALSGQEHGFELADIIEILGEEKTKNRLKGYLNG